MPQEALGLLAFLIYTDILVFITHSRKQKTKTLKTTDYDLRKCWFTLPPTMGLRVGTHRY